MIRNPNEIQEGAKKIRILVAGYPSGREPEVPICPVCDAECDTIYIGHNGDYIGCENCVTTRDAWEVIENLSDN